MRKLAAQGAVPCDVSNGKEIPSDLLAANCIPPGFMVQVKYIINYCFVIVVIIVVLFVGVIIMIL